MKIIKFLSAALALAVLTGFGGTALAAETAGTADADGAAIQNAAPENAKTPDKGLGIDTSKLTDAQKAELSALAKSSAEKVKTEIEKLRLTGVITKAQADSASSLIDKRLLKQNGKPFMPFFGARLPFIDPSVLTAEQKTAFESYRNAVKTAAAAYIDKLFSLGVITAETRDMLKDKAEKGGHKRCER